MSKSTRSVASPVVTASLPELPANIAALWSVLDDLDAGPSNHLTTDDGLILLATVLGQTIKGLKPMADGTVRRGATVNEVRWFGGVKAVKADIPNNVEEVKEVKGPLTGYSETEILAALTANPTLFERIEKCGARGQNPVGFGLNKAEIRKMFAHFFPASAPDSK